MKFNSADEKLTKFTQGVSEAIMETTGCDVTICDKNNTRIAGTGIFKSMIGKKIPKNSAFAKSMLSKTPVIINDPRNSEVCSDCENLENCKEEYEICMPIILDNEAVAVIAIIATSEFQKNILIKKEKSFLKYTINMAKLLATYFGELKLKEQLEVRNEEISAVIDNIQNGIICISKEGKILYINQVAIESLKLKKSRKDLYLEDIERIWKNSLLSKYYTEESGDFINEEEVLDDGHGNKKIISTSIKKIYDNEKLASIICIFSDSVNIQKTAAIFRESNSEASFDTLIGDSEVFKRTKERAKIAANYDSTVLITGESGTGKELFARALHEASERRDQPFVSINCSAIPETLLESELFGYESGAFTGANRRGKLGKMEIANNGTFFMDEIGDMTLYLQAKLLRVLQDKTIIRVGGTKSIALNLKIIAATNKDLKSMVKSGEFREDLYYRINVIPINLPPLRDRVSDIKVLANYFVRLNNERFHKNIQGFDDEAIKIMENYAWPGNIRELQNVIEFLSNFKSSGLITAKDLRYRISESQMETLSLNERVRDFEKKIIEETLQKYGNTKNGREKAAEELKISRATLYRKIN